MSRTSSDEIKDGRVWTGFDYALQCWVVSGVIQDCGHSRLHPHQWRPAAFCCRARELAGQRLADVTGHEKR